jgi:serine/threonine-protein kinase
MLTPGQRVDRYDIEGLIGEGGMAEVYRVRHRTLGSIHALKLLKLHAPSLRERLLQEGRTQATLRHPNVVSVTDVVDVDGAPALILDFIDGPSLETWLDTHRPSLAEAERLFAGIVAGVERAHRAGLVHRDLKPANVLLERGEDGRLVPRVTDFGLVKVLSEDGTAVGRTRAGVPMGSPPFMAPEQIRDSRSVDRTADLFALGCILYELVTGRRAFDGEDFAEVFQAVLAGKYVRVEEIAPATPERIRRAIAGCLVIDREKRIPSTDALRKVLAGPGMVRPRVAATTPVMLTASLGSELVEVAPSVGTWGNTEEDEGLELDPSDGEIPLRGLDEEQASTSRSPARTFASIVPPATRDPWATQEVEPRRTARWVWAVAGVGVLGVGMVAAFAVGGAWWASTEGQEAGNSPAAAVSVDAVASRGAVEPGIEGAGDAAASMSPSSTPASEPAPTTAAPLPNSEPVRAAPAESPSAPARVRPTATTATFTGTSKPEPREEAPSAKPEASAPPPSAAVAAKRVGFVRVAGGVERVALVGPAGTYGPGSVPIGSYDLMATFPGRAEAVAGRVTVRADETVAITCHPDFRICRMEAP